MFEYLETRAGQSDNLALHLSYADLTIELRCAKRAEYLTISKGQVSVALEASGTDIDFVLSASEEAWQEQRKTHPGRDYQALSTMRRTGKLAVSGDMLAFNQHLLALEMLFVPPERLLCNGSAAEAQAVAQLENVVGRYLNLAIDGRIHRLYFEEAGAGIPLVCLHTAGADGRQFRHILNDPQITERFRVIVFDLPWHGKSSPPEGFQDNVYQLTTENYMHTTMAVIKALGLDRPVVMGCSIGGRAVLHLAMRHGELMRAVIGLQSALYAEDKTGHGDPGSARVLHRPDVHGGKLAGALMNGVMAPQSPTSSRWETMWHYMQGGPGVFWGDLHYYFDDGDMRNLDLSPLRTGKCPVYLLSGEYDPSATPEMGRELAQAIDAAHFEVMHGMGHFPMSENPDAFRNYLLPLLERIEVGENSGERQ